jgi:hypothetical protein
MGCYPSMVGMSRARRKMSNKRRERQTVKLTKRQIQEQFAKQRQQAKERQQRKQAYAARNAYRPRKKDFGKLTFIGIKGQKDPQAKGRKGYLLYVTKTGKKWLVKQVTNTRNVSQYKPRKLTSIAPRESKTLRNKIKAFTSARLVRVSSGKAAVKGKGSVRGSSGQYDFSDKVVAKIAKALKKTIESQRSHRVFVIRAMMLIQLPDHTQETIEIEVPIEKADNISIRLAGLINFIRQKFYRYMARELAFHGYVTVGSSNHTRRLADNEGLDREDWTDSRGEKWKGARLDVVRILRIDWIVEQSSTK